MFLTELFQVLPMLLLTALRETGQEEITLVVLSSKVLALVLDVRCEAHRR